MTSNHNSTEGETFLFTSESVGEGTSLCMVPIGLAHLDRRSFIHAMTILFVMDVFDSFLTYLHP